MPRISYPDPDSLDEQSRQYLEHARLHGTPRPESQTIRAHVPAVLRSFSETWNDVFRNGVLDHTIKELCRVFVSRSVHCDYCGDQRSEKAKDAGLTEDAYQDLFEFRTSDRYDERERTALAYTEAIVWDASLADDALWERLHQHFTEPEIVELGYFVAITLGQQRWLPTLGIDHYQVLDDTDAGLAPDRTRARAGG